MLCKTYSFLWSHRMSDKEQYVAGGNTELGRSLESIAWYSRDHPQKHVKKRALVRHLPQTALRGSISSSKASQATGAYRLIRSEELSYLPTRKHCT